MVKSRAEICRDYRKRLKEKDNDGYLRKERLRRRKNYVPSEMLSQSEKKKRRSQVRDAVRRYRLKKKQMQIDIQQINEQAENVAMTSGYESMDSSDGPLLVALNFNRKAKGPRTRLANQLKTANEELSTLRKTNIVLARKLKTEQRKRQRLLKRLQSSPRTPKSKTEAVMNSAGLSSSQKNAVRREILFGNVVADQIHDKKMNYSKSNIGSLHMLLAGQIIRKYRCNTVFCNKTGLNKNTCTRYGKKESATTKTPMPRKFEQKVIEFFERDDNSRVQPGKADSVKHKEGEKQVRVLTDYLLNLHNKFLSENVDCQISFATFCRIRPKYIQISAFISRSSCLCTQHQNMALTAKTLRSRNILVSANPEVFVRGVLDREDLENKLPENIELPQWKRIEIDDRGKRKYVMRVVSTNMTKQEFLQHVDTQRIDFANHVNRMKTQYDQIKTLKQILPENHVVMHMDFAENFACRSSEEIQSAYFNQTSVTLHPCVLYYMQDNILKHKSIVIVSDTQAHNAQTVVTFLDTIASAVKEIVANVHTCHYWTDSPTSQYRNKLIFDIVANHLILYGYHAVWNYFEAGHGKGPCDGLGGTVKRMADIAIKSRRAVIQDASDFFSWASERSTFTNVDFKYVSDNTITNKVSELEKHMSELKPIKGTMKLHAVAGTGSSTVLVRETSCYCPQCLTGDRCDTWRKESTRKVNFVQTKNKVNREKKCHFDVGIFVAAIYQSKWYIGTIESEEDDEHEVEINFMESKKQLFQWPSQPDKIWMDVNDILCVIRPPVETGKSRRMFRLAAEDKALVENLFKERS